MSITPSSAAREILTASAARPHSGSTKVLIAHGRKAQRSSGFPDEHKTAPLFAGAVSSELLSLFFAQSFQRTR